MDPRQWMIGPTIINEVIQTQEGNECEGFEKKKKKKEDADSTVASWQFPLPE